MDPCPAIRPNHVCHRTHLNPKQIWPAQAIHTLQIGVQAHRSSRLASTACPRNPYLPQFSYASSVLSSFGSKCGPKVSDVDGLSVRLLSKRASNSAYCVHENVHNICVYVLSLFSYRLSGRLGTRLVAGQHAALLCQTCTERLQDLDCLEAQMKTS